MRSPALALGRVIGGFTLEPLAHTGRARWTLRSRNALRTASAFRPSWPFGSSSTCRPPRTTTSVESTGIERRRTLRMVDFAVARWTSVRLTFCAHAADCRGQDEPYRDTDDESDTP